MNTLWVLWDVFTPIKRQHETNIIQPLIKAMKRAIKDQQKMWYKSLKSDIGA